MIAGSATSLGLLIILALVLGTAWGLATPAILRWLPEPASGDLDDDPKLPYADLATRPFAVTVGVLATVATGVSAGALVWGTLVSGPAASGAAASRAADPLGSIELLPPWLVLATLGVQLAAIDARTTWLPLPLTRAAWIAMAAAVVLSGLLGGWAVALRGVVGFAVAGVIFGAIWLLTRGGFGFGDVRYAPLVGAATASISWTMLAWALVLGSLVGAALGLVRLVRRRRGAFAYAPAILAGGYLAIALAWLAT